MRKMILTILFLLSLVGCSDFIGFDYEEYYNEARLRERMDYGSDYHYPTYSSSYGSGYYPPGRDYMLGRITLETLNEMDTIRRPAMNFWRERTDYWESQREFRENYDKLMFDEAMRRGNTEEYLRDYYNIKPIPPLDLSYLRQPTPHRGW